MKKLLPLQTIRCFHTFCYHQRRANKRFIRVLLSITCLIILSVFLYSHRCNNLVSFKPPNANRHDDEMRQFYTKNAVREPYCLDGTLQHDYFQAFYLEASEIAESCGAFLSSPLYNNRSDEMPPDENSRDELYFARHRLVVDLEQWLKARYFTMVRQTFAPTSRCVRQPKYVVYSCERRNLCGGFGDRTRGMVTLFYLALLSNRVFHVRWLQPVDLAAYFALNVDLYGAKQYYIPSKVDDKLMHRKFIDSKDLISFEQLLSETNFTRDHLTETIMPVSTNLLLISNSTGLFNNDHFLSSACFYFNEFPRVEELTRSVLHSAALRILLGKPTPRLRYEFDSFVAKLVFPSVANYQQRNVLWEETFKIGIQMRFEMREWSENPANRVSFDQIDCFVNEALRIVGKRNISNVLVFVTSSSNEASQKVVFDLKTRRNIRTFALTIAPVVHVDRYFWLPSIENAGNMTRRDLLRGNTKVVLDWYLLTQMNQLIVSQSSFANSASLFSMAPTRIFDHRFRGDAMMCKFYDSIDQTTS